MVFSPEWVVITSYHQFRSTSDGNARGHASEGTLSLKFLPLPKMNECPPEKRPFDKRIGSSSIVIIFQGVFGRVLGVC